MKDTVYRSDGSLASGTVVITWPAFVTADTKAVFGGTKTIPLTNGALAVGLVPNSGGTPSGTSYNVKYYQSGGVFFEETWVVPTSSPVASPAAPTSVTQTGTPGTTTYYYWVSATNANGETLLGPSRVTTTSNATLSMTNYNVITWASVSGATGYRVWRTSTATPPTGTGNYLVGSTASTTINDQSNTLTSATVPTLNTTDPRPLSQVRVTSAPSSTVTLAASQVQGTAIVSNPSSTQTITAPPSSGIPLQIKGRSSNNLNVFELYDNQATPTLQSWFDPNGALNTSKAPTFSAFTSGSLLFAGTGGLLSQNNANLFWDGTAAKFRAGPPATSFTVGSNARDFVIPRSKHNLTGINPTASSGLSLVLGVSAENSTMDSAATAQFSMEDRNSSGTRTALYGSLSSVFHSGGGSVTQMLSEDIYTEHTGTGAVTNFYGARYYLSHGGFNAASTAGATTNMEALQTGADVSGTNPISNLVGLHVASHTKAGSGSLSNNYGIKVENQGGVGSNNWAIRTGTGKVQFGDDVIADKNLAAKAISQVRFADQFSGSDAGAKIAAAIADLPSTGGIVDARGLEGAQTISQDIFASAPSGGVQLLCGAASFTVNTTQNLPRSVRITGPTYRGLNSPAMGCVFQAAFTGPVFKRDAVSLTVTDILLENFTVKGNKTTYGAGDGIVLNNTQDAAMHNVAIDSFGTNNISIGPSSNNIFIRDIYSAQAGGANYSITGAHVSLIRAVSDGAPTSLQINSGASDVSILDSHFEGATSVAVSNSGARTRIVSTLLLPASGAAGISTTNASRPIINSNEIIGTSGTTGLDLEGTTSELGISNNIFSGFAIGVKFRGSGTGIIEGNTVIASTTALDITPPSFNFIIVSGNNFGGGTNSILHNSGDTAIYIGNRTEDGNGNYKAPTITAGSPLLIQSKVSSGVNRLSVSTPLDVDRAISSAMTTVSFSAIPTFDASLGNSFKMTLTDNVTSSAISNPQTGEFITLLLCQDAMGSRTMTWPTNLKLAGGTFALTGTANKCDSLTAVYDGTNWYETTRATNL